MGIKVIKVATPPSSLSRPNQHRQAALQPRANLAPVQQVPIATLTRRLSRPLQLLQPITMADNLRTNRLPLQATYENTKVHAQNLFPNRLIGFNADYDYGMGTQL